MAPAFWNKTSQVALIGTRELDPEESRFIEHNDLSVLTPAEVQVQALLQLLSEKAFNHVYIHVDLDVLDPASYPHMLLPTKNGIEPDLLLNCIVAIKKQFNLVGSSILEYVPKNNSGIGLLKSLIAELS